MRKNITIPTMIVSLLLLVVSCEKPEIGYLSENMFYNNSVYKVQRGQTTFTAPLVANGSSSPLYVELLKVKDSVGNDVTAAFKDPGNIRIYDQPVTYKDSTLELLYSRFKDSIVQPFRINPIGGRMEFTPATRYLPGGKYTIDIKASNIKGERIIEDAARIVLTESTGAPYILQFKRISSVGGIYNTDDGITVDVVFTPGTEENTKCIYKFVDKNGVVFNPNAGEITRRSATFPFFDDWAPWFPVIKTNTAFEQQMPGLNGIKFPYFTRLFVGTSEWNDINARYDLKIPKGHLNEVDEDLFVLISFNYFVPGTFEITVHINPYTKKTI